MAIHRVEQLPEDEQGLPSWEERWPPHSAEFKRRFKISPIGRVVCGRCVEDEILRAMFCNSTEKISCDYCGRESPPFADAIELFKYVYQCLLLEYGDPWLHAIFWDKEDGVWIGISELDTHDVLNEVDSPLGDGSALAESFASKIEHDWFLIDSEVGTIEERTMWSWDSFEQRLLSGPRFLFSPTETDPDNPPEMSANALFRYLAKLGERLQTDFVKRAESGLRLYRARACPTGYLSSPDELGSPRAAIALPQRLSAAGVSCFYASEDEETAVEETKSGDIERISVGHWNTTEPLVYADFASPFELPSLFDPASSPKRPDLRFLKEFVERVRRPTEQVRGDANSYLATQVLGEFLRYYLPTKWKPGVDAVRFPSSVRPGGTNWVLFGQPDREGEPRIKLTDVTHL